MQNNSQEIVATATLLQHFCASAAAGMTFPIFQHGKS
jgi:hypothetical protein